ncbi:uncharacterized protein LOC113290681 [Papaver somniferum]|uniref:uncharacterized protein LOC113290681 n=1 Tax=Papaver somniferum TaxID=3469 RepID=UPI000E7011F0|nr:uncharacterized protein LOC113290681 [Papaver somniferum]
MDMDVYMILSSKESDEKHISTSIDPLDTQHDITFRSNLEDLEDLYNRVVVHESASQVLQNSGLARFFEIRIKRDDQQLAYAIIERWWYSTNSFHFPNFEIGFTPLDFVHLTGIPVRNGRRRLEHAAKNRWKSIENQKLEDTYFRPMHGYAHYNKHSPEFPISCLANYIKDNPINDENWEIVTRYFLLWVISKVLMARTTTRASKVWIDSLRDLNAIGNYDWASACFSHLYSSMSVVSRGGKNMCGMAMVLEYWFYIYFRTLTPFLQEGVPTDVWPAVMIFKKDSLVKLQRGTSKHSLNTARQQIELRTIVGTEWQPWSTTMYKYHPDIVHAREISNQRVAFYNPESETSIMYLGERCLRKTRGFITIPRSPRERLEDLATSHDPIDVVE